MAAVPERTTNAEDAMSAPLSGAQGDRTLELVQEELWARKTSIQTGVIRIRKQVITETRTVQVTVRREEVVVERLSNEQQAAADPRAAQGLTSALAAEVRDLKPGETIRIPVIEEEVVVQTQPTVVGEVVVGKHLIEEKQFFSGTVRREELHVRTTSERAASQVAVERRS